MSHYILIDLIVDFNLWINIRNFIKNNILCLVLPVTNLNINSNLNSKLYSISWLNAIYFDLKKTEDRLMIAYIILWYVVIGELFTVNKVLALSCLIKYSIAPGRHPLLRACIVCVWVQIKFVRGREGYFIFFEFREAFIVVHTVFKLELSKMVIKTTSNYFSVNKITWSFIRSFWYSFFFIKSLTFSIGRPCMRKFKSPKKNW